MISGVDLGTDKRSASQLEFVACSKIGAKLEIWLDDLISGKLIATVPVIATGENNWKTFTKTLKGVSGRHDIFVKFPKGNDHAIFIKTIKFLPPVR